MNWNEYHARDESPGGGGPEAQAERDHRTLALAHLTVERVDANPNLVVEARVTIARWHRAKMGYTPHAEWEEILSEYGWETIREVFLEDSRRGRRLRRSHPFVGLLALEERNAIEAPSIERERKIREGADKAAHTEGGHPAIDRMGLAYARILAKKIDTDRTLLQVGLDNIERWAKLHGDLPRAHEEWRNLIEGEPWEKLRDMLIEESDEGQRLRSSSPFAGIVTPAERERILAAKGEPPPATEARARTRKARRYVGIPTHRNR